MDKGTRVRVRIPSEKGWNREAYKAMQGHTGVIEVGFNREGSCLVMFDEPIPAWHANCLPVKGFHFAARELEALDEDEPERSGGC